MEEITKEVQLGTTNVTINRGTIQCVYGGGNEAVSNLTNVNIFGQVTGNVFGGCNQAGVNTNTNLIFNNATVGQNVYGGGDEGTVTGNTNVRVTDSTLQASVYAAGNGSTAIVYGNATITLDGDNDITNNVFGGGNKAQTGTSAANNSTTTVNIVGGTIGGNVYGGANTSVVYGFTQTNIGYDAVGQNNLTIGDIEIGGTVFGGGEANESGSENYDFSFISVTRGIDILIDGNNHNRFAISGSIFGSGNASSTSGTSNIVIKNYGTFQNPQKNISLQRTDCATIINSAFSLSGATDRTNEYSTTFFSISNVERVKLANGSTIFLNNGANLLKYFDSVLIDQNNNETKAEVTIDPQTGAVSKNVDNRLYMLEGKNLNIATNQQATAYGIVYGMSFFGIYTNRNNPATSTGLYHNSYNQGDEATNLGTFSLNSYVKAQHLSEHNIKADGFYTNYNEGGTIKVDYVGVTPPDDVYYMWYVGEELDVTVFEDIDLIASKYTTLGTYELTLSGFADPNIKMVLSGFSAGLEEGISLVNPNLIETIQADEDVANSTYGLAIKTGNVGWMTRGATTFLTQDGGTYTGTTTYRADNSTATPTFNICFYHSQNISVPQRLGELRIRLQVLTPMDDLNDRISWIDIVITLTSALFPDYNFEAAITPGEEFELFTTTDTTINDNGQFSAYYSLFIDEFTDSDFYTDFSTYHRVLVSRNSQNAPYCFPENTKITMLNMRTNQYYYYIVSAQDVNNNKFKYNLSDFIAMGSIDKNYSETEAFNDSYLQNLDLVVENYIFHIDFKDSTVPNDIIENSLLIELQDRDNQTLVGVLGIQRDTMVYNVYRNKDATIEVDAEVSPETAYLGNVISLNVVTEFTQKKTPSQTTIYDTQFFEKKLGIKIGIYNNQNTLISNISLLGVYYELNGVNYYPRFDGTTRICISDKVTDVLAKIKIHTENNKTLATGDYTIRIDSFGSADGIYYGLTPSDTVDVSLRVINQSYGIKVTTPDQAKIVERATGKLTNGNNTLVSTIQYSSNLTYPNVRVSLYRRDYSSEGSQLYNLVDLQDYVENTLVITNNAQEYSVTTTPQSSMNFSLVTDEDLPSTGTFKLVYKLYDSDVYIGEVFEYVIIK